MKKIIFISLLFSVSAFAEFSIENTIPFQQASCTLGNLKATFYLRFDKKPPLLDNDYSGAPLVFVKGENSKTVEGKPGDYSFVKPLDKSSCDATEAYPVGSNTLAIFYSKDNRPFQSNYMVVIYDMQASRIVEKKELGAVTDLFRTKTGFAFATMIPRSDADEIEVLAPTSKRIMATDQDLKAIQTVKLEGDSLKFTYDPGLSYAKSDWKRYFKTKDEYLKSAGWDSNRSAFTNVVVYEGSHYNRRESDYEESCIAMTNRRGGEINRSDWHCLKEKR